MCFDRRMSHRGLTQLIRRMALTAVLIAGMVSLGLSGDYVYFGVMRQTLSVRETMLAAPVAGVLGGLMGAFFSRAVLATGRWAVSLLGHADRQLADAMAGLAPAPGGPFRLAQWRETDWGPVLAGSPGWLGAHLLTDPVEAGWSMLVRGVVDHSEIDESHAPVAYVRGQYREL